MGECTTMTFMQLLAEGFQWYIWRNGNMEPIEGANSRTYTTGPITESVKYTCVAEGISENSVPGPVRDFYIDLDSGLWAEASGETKKVVSPEEQTTLRVQASVDVGNVSYQWYRKDMTEMISGAAGNACTLGPFTGSEVVGCRVSDDFGNTKDICFTIQVDSGFNIPHQITETVVNKGECATLHPYAYVNYGQLRYQWYQGDTKILLSGRTDSSFTTEPLEHMETYTCRISDEYGNSGDITFSVKINNGFQAEAMGKQFRIVEPGESVTMTVSASCNEGELTYTWREAGAAGSGVLSTNASLTVENLIYNAKYECLVEDQYGNSQNVDFLVISSGRVFRQNGVEGSTWNGATLALSIQPARSNAYKIVTDMEYYCAEYVELYDQQGNLICHETWSNWRSTLTANLTAGNTYYYIIFNVQFIDEEEDSAWFYISYFESKKTREGRLHLQPGQTVQLPLPDDGGELINSYTYDSDVATVSGSIVTATDEWEGYDLSTDIALETEEYEIKYTVDVLTGPVIHLPSGLQKLEESAFEGDQDIFVVELGEDVREVGPHAFIESSLQQIVIPGMNTVLSPTAFRLWVNERASGDVLPLILCHPGCAAEAFALRYKYDYAYLH